MLVKLLELGTMVSDTVSGTKGMLTHLYLETGDQKRYIYQPRGLNPKDGKPVQSIFVDESRISGGKYVEVELPTNALGTPGEDIATGFKGTIIGLTYHINGCTHVEIKPKGINKQTGATFDSHEFDIRRVKGKVIKPLAKKALKKSIQQSPSPMPKSGIGK